MGRTCGKQKKATAPKMIIKNTKIAAATVFQESVGLLSYIQELEGKYRCPK